jgi:hypothetical protein
MTIERKIVVGLEDIQEVRLKCLTEGCNERVAILTSRGAVSASCRHNHEWKIPPESLFGTFLLALAERQKMQEIAKEAGFSILLEFSETVK